MLCEDGLASIPSAPWVRERRQELQDERTQAYPDVRATRQRCWVCLESALQKRERAWARKEQMAKENAPNIATERFEIYRRTKEGRHRLRFDSRHQLSRKRGMGSPTLAWWTSGKKARRAAEAVVYGKVRDEILGDHLEEIDNEFRERQRARAADSKKRTTALVEQWGTAHQTWDEVWDAERERWIWYDAKKGGVRDNRPHVCEQCNNVMEEGDLKCFSCGMQRSELNRRLFEQCQPAGLLHQDYHEAAPAPEYDDW